MQTPFPHVSAHRRRVNVVLRRAVQTVPCEPKRQLKRLRGFRALHFHPGVRHQTHGFLVDSVAVVPRGTRHHFVIILVAHHVIHAVVDEHGDFVLRAVPNEVVDEPEVEFYFRGVSSREGELHHGRALDIRRGRAVRVGDELRVQQTKVQAAAMAEVGGVELGRRGAVIHAGVRCVVTGGRVL